MEIDTKLIKLNQDLTNEFDDKDTQVIAVEWDRNCYKIIYAKGMLGTAFLVEKEGADIESIKRVIKESVLPSFVAQQKLEENKMTEEEITKEVVEQEAVAETEETKEAEEVPVEETVEETDTEAEVETEAKGAIEEKEVDVE